MASIEKRRGAWRVRWRDPDGSARARRCPNQKTARALKRQVEEATALGRRWEPDGSGEVRQLRQVAEAWILDLARTRQPKTMVTVASRLENLLRFLTEHTGAEPTLQDLSRESLSAGWAWLRRPNTGPRGRALAVHSANLHLGTWEGLWAWAWDHDDYGPLTPRPRKIERPKRPVSVALAPSWAEVDAMLEELQSRRRHLDEIDWALRTMTLVRYTGCRLSAALALRWDDVDMARGSLSFRAETTKTRRGRTIPLHPGLAVALAGWGRREGRLCGVEGPLRQTHQTVSSHTIGRMWRRTQARPKVYERRPVHSLRRAWRTHLVAARVHPDVIDALLGHVGRGTGARVYTDPTALWPQMVEAVSQVPVIGGAPTAHLALAGKGAQ